MVAVEAAPSSPAVTGVTGPPQAQAELRVRPLRRSRLVRQLVLLQLASAAIAVAMVSGARWSWLAAPIGVAVLALIPPIGDPLRRWCQLQSRRLRVSGAGSPAVPDALLVAPLRAGKQLGVLAAGSGLTSAFAVAADGPIELPWLAAQTQVDDVPLAGVHLVIRMMHRAPTLPTAHPAVQSYRTLNQLGSPTLSQAWLFVRLDVSAAADGIAARGGGTAGALRAMSRVAHRLGAPGREGARLSPVDPVALRQVLTDLTTTPHADAGTNAVAGTERWSSWQDAGGHQVSLQLRRWPTTAPAIAQLIEATRVVSARGSTTCATVTVSVHRDPHARTTPGRGSAEVAILVRLGGSDLAEARAAARQLVTDTTAIGARWQLLDGDQLPGLRAGLGLT